MAKDEELRLMETLARVPDLVDGPRGEQIRSVLHQWLQRHTDHQGLSQALSFGGWHPFSSASEQALRHYRRALLMAYAYSGVQHVAGKQDQVKGMDATKVKAEFLKLFGELGPPVGALAATLAASFNFATAGEKHWAIDACREVPGRLSRVVAALSSARQNTTEKTRFEKWFGRYTEQKLGLILRNFQMMLSCRKGIALYYRGNSLRFGNTEIVPPNLTPVDIGTVKDAGYYSADKDRDNDPKFAHIFLGAAMFGDKVKTTGKVGVSTSRAAVIIHELSHYVCKTNDEKSTKGPGGVMYGGKCCSEEAAANNQKVLTNASNYQWYSDEFSGG